MAIKFVLKETLKTRNISRNKLHMKGNIRLATLQEMDNDQSKQIKLETLNNIIKTINRLSDDSFEKAGVSDVIIFIDDDEEGEDKE